MVIEVVNQVSFLGSGTLEFLMYPARCDCMAKIGQTGMVARLGDWNIGYLLGPQRQMDYFSLSSHLKIQIFALIHPHLDHI